MDRRQEKACLSKMIGENVTSLRTALRMTKAELSQLSNVSPTQISHIESARRGVTLVTLTKLAKAFDVTVDFLLLKPQETGMDEWEGYRATRNIRKIHKLLTYLSDTDLIFLLHKIDSLLPHDARNEDEEK